MLNRVNSKSSADCDSAFDHYNRFLFESSPLSLWIEDLSEIKIIVDGLIMSGIKDCTDYMWRHPLELASLADKVRTLDVNEAAIAMFASGDREIFLTRHNQLIVDDVYLISIIGFMTRAGNETCFRKGAVVSTSTGKPIKVLLRWNLVKDDTVAWSRVLVSASPAIE